MAKRKFLQRVCLVVLFYSCLIYAVSSDEKPSSKIIIYGDSQIDEKAIGQVVQAVFQEKPGIIFRVGDLENNGNDPQEWVKANQIAAPLLQTTEYFPALGNHEMESPLYFQNFPQIKNHPWYSVDRQGIHFIVLDSNATLGKGSEQYTWLESDLKQIGSNADFALVLFHHPLFDVGPHGEDEKGLRSTLTPLFEKYGVGAVFSGHDHNYQRFLYNKICYIVTGGGGSPLNDKTRTSPYLIKFRKTYHFCLLLREKNILRVKVFDVHRFPIDEFVIPTISKVRSGAALVKEASAIR